jgi:hypothetical protein
VATSSAAWQVVLTSWRPALLGTGLKQMLDYSERKQFLKHVSLGMDLQLVPPAKREVRAR